MVLTLTAEEVMERLNRGVNEKNFQGTVTAHSFQLNVRVIRPTQFQPVIKGRLEATSRGSILFLQYRLLPSTQVYLVFWSIVMLAAACFAAYAKSNVLWTGVGLGMVWVVRWIALSNLKLQVAPARTRLLEQLS
jgi:hypothetical protein